MKIKYSPHAKKRLKERKINKSGVTLVLTKPDNKVFGGRNRIIVNRKFKDYTLEAVYVIEGGEIIVITLYYI